MSHVTDRAPAAWITSHHRRSRRCRACRLDSERWWGEEEKQQEQKQQQERDGGSRGRTSTKSSRQYGEEEG